MEVSQEPRSFAPERRMKVDPVPELGADTDALARGVNQLHKCLEDEKRKSASHRATMQRQLREMKATQQKLVKAQGLQPGGKKVAGLSSSWESFRRTVYATTTSITALAVLYVVGRFIAWPMLVTGWTAFDHIASRGGF